MIQIPLSRKILDFIQECFGRPASLYTLIENCPDISMQLNEPKHSISYSDSIVFWQNWQSFGNNRRIGEVQSFNGNNRFSKVLTELSNFTTHKIIENWQCDIQEVVGLSGSKSTLKDFATLDQMVETNSQEMITPATIDKLHQNLEHREIRIIHNKNTDDHFVQYMWDGRLFLINAGGSHHFAAARYIARLLKIPVLLHANLHIYSINEQSVISLCDKYEIFTVKNKYFACFYEKMRIFRVSFMWYPLPKYYDTVLFRNDCEDYRLLNYIILLPKNEKKSMKIAKILHQSNFFDFGKYLYSLVERQNRNMNL